MVEKLYLCTEVLDELDPSTIFCSADTRLVVCMNEFGKYVAPKIQSWH